MSTTSVVLLTILGLIIKQRISELKLMLSFLLKKEVGLIAITLFALINGILIFNEIYLQLLLPVLILITYWFIFRLDLVFLLIVFCTPLSFNFENLFTGGIGFYFPTEPLLLGFSLIFILKLILNKKLKDKLYHLRHPLTVLIILHFCWMFITSISQVKCLLFPSSIY